MERGHLSERDAAVNARAILEVIRHCHSRCGLSPSSYNPLARFIWWHLQLVLLRMMYEFLSSSGQERCWNGFW